jgi:hypothetical protein
VKTPFKKNTVAISYNKTKFYSPPNCSSPSFYTSILGEDIEIAIWNPEQEAHCEERDPNR